jgi:hypothetical protein
MAEALVNQRDDAAQHHCLRRHQRHLHLRSGNTRLEAGASVCGTRLSGRQARRHTGGLAGRQTRSIVSIAAVTALLHDFDGCWIDLPEPVRPLQWARTAVRLSPPHLTSLQLVRQCAGGKHSEPPERLTAAHAAQRTEAPVPHLRWDWDWAWAGTT